MECYICYEKEKQNDKFCSMNICQCKGTTKIHISCFEKLKREFGDTCTICKSKFKENVNQEYKNPNTLSGYQLLDYDNYETLQELFILEEHFYTKKHITIQKEKDCCNII